MILRKIRLYLLLMGAHNKTIIASVAAAWGLYFLGFPFNYSAFRELWVFSVIAYLLYKVHALSESSRGTQLGLWQLSNEIPVKKKRKAARHKN